MRNTLASPITASVIDRFGAYLHASNMLSARELLDALDAKSVSRADIARALGIAPPRVTELYKGERQLKLDEAKRLVEAFNLDGDASLSPVLSEQVSRLLVLHVASHLAMPIDPADERVEGLALDLQALSQFARDHRSELSTDAASGFLRGRKGNVQRIDQASRTRNRNR